MAREGWGGRVCVPQAGRGVVGKVPRERWARCGVWLRRAGFGRSYVSYLGVWVFLFECGGSRFATRSVTRGPTSSCATRPALRLVTGPRQLNAADCRPAPITPTPPCVCTVGWADAAAVGTRCGCSRRRSCVPARWPISRPWSCVPPRVPRWPSSCFVFHPLLTQILPHPVSASCTRHMFCL